MDAAFHSTITRERKILNLGKVEELKQAGTRRTDLYQRIEPEEHKPICIKLPDKKVYILKLSDF